MILLLYFTKHSEFTIGRKMPTGTAVESLNTKDQAGNPTGKFVIL